ncbi:MAG TPA: metallophosphoesterase [Myxococcaceae bacterium]|nr:metallophosphoesterase [Myxococcaceae bacterium]
MMLRLLGFSLYLLTLNFLFHWYLLRRWLPGALDDPQRRRRAWRWALMVAVAMVVLQGAGRLAPSPWLRALIYPGVAWTGFALYLTAATVGLDFLQLGRRLWARRKGASVETSRAPLQPERRAFLGTALGTGALAATGGLATFGTWRAYQPAEVTEVQVKLPYLPSALDGFTLVQLSDVHIGAVLQRKFLEDLVARANGLRPDLVAITGDLVDGSVPRLAGHVGALRDLRSRYGTHFITGNHDYYSGADAWVEALRSIDIQVLRNRYVRIGEGAQSFDLIGVDDWMSKGKGGYDLDAAVAGRTPERAAVLLAHQPKDLENVARRGIGLQLSGHTHGGQMWPGTWVSDLTWGPRSHGLSRFEGLSVYVSRGCGFVGPSQRAGSPPELVKIVLRAG